MATPFSRTIRSLEHDRSNHYISLIGLLMTIFLALLWGYWFLTAPILGYAVSHEVSVTSDTELATRLSSDGIGAVRSHLIQRQAILAKFPATAMKHLQPGQSAFLRFEGEGKPRGAIPAMVAFVILSPSTGQGTVKLYTETTEFNSLPLESGEGGVVSVEHHRGVPAQLVLRASGLFTDTPPVSVSPLRIYLP